jgi:hypothetical protein
MSLIFTLQRYVVCMYEEDIDLIKKVNLSMSAIRHQAKK